MRIALQAAAADQAGIEQRGVIEAVLINPIRAAGEGAEYTEIGHVSR